MQKSAPQKRRTLLAFEEILCYGKERADVGGR